jgi:7-carboxy-7-deazaguanine synthase
MSQIRILALNEIFFSIQGESTQAGRPCTFVRLMGCPLRCKYCDTEYAFFEGKKWGFDEIFSELEKFPTKLIEVTGGEPLAQPNSIAFMQELVDRNYEVLIETSGAFPISEIPPQVRVILDIKTPGSGELSRMRWENLAALKRGYDEVKFVVTSKEDFDFAVTTAQEHKLFDRLVVLISPSFKDVSNLQLAEWVLSSGKPFRMQLQMHKYIWEPEKRGV